MRRRLVLIAAMGSSLFLGGCAAMQVVGAVGEATYDVQNDKQYEGRVDFVEELADGKKKIRFIGGREYTLFRIGSAGHTEFKKPEYVKIYKSKEGYWAEINDPYEKQTYEGVVERIEVRNSTTLVQFTGGVSYEVYGQPEIKPGMKATIYKEGDSNFIVRQTKEEK